MTDAERIAAGIAHDFKDDGYGLCDTRVTGQTGNTDKCDVPRDQHGGSGAGSNQDGVTLEVMASLMALRDAVERRTAEDQYCWVCQRTWGMPKTRLEQHAEDCALFNVRKVVGYARP